MSAAGDLLAAVETYERAKAESDLMAAHATPGWIPAAVNTGDALRELVKAACAWTNEARHSVIGIEDGDDTWGFIMESVTDLLDDARQTWESDSDFDSSEWAARFVTDERAAMAERSES